MIEKGNYGYAKKLKNKTIALLIACFLMILSDVLISLIVFQTRKTLFIVVGCVMSIPFARNLINYIMIVHFEPLTEEMYKKAENIASKIGFVMAYDLSITDSDGVLFIPCAAVYNNNVIAYIPDSNRIGKKREVKDYLAKCSDDKNIKPRTVAVSSLEQLEKELRRVGEPSAAQKKNDVEIAEKLLSLGI